MKRLTVILSRAAKDQIDDQTLYIADRSLMNAIKWAKRVSRAVDGLGGHWGHTVDEEASERCGFEVRRYAFEKNYLIFYSVNLQAGTIEVVGFRHGARMPGPGEP